MLVGRGREQARLGQLVDAARTGVGGALVVLGEPGSGKSVLLDDLATTATTGAEEVTVLRTQGIEQRTLAPRPTSARTPALVATSW